MKLLALVVGAGGQLGRAMASQLAGRHEVVAYSRAELNLTAKDDVLQAIGSLCPDVIINCAAYNDVDGAERDPTTALAVNAWAVGTLSRAAIDTDATLVHFSTDFVFDGETDRPYVETDEPNPRNTYAMSKLLGEWLAAEAPRHYVLRVESLFGGDRGRSSLDRIVASLRRGEPVRAFSDRTVSPSFVDDIVTATSELLARESPFGLYHCVNTGATTWLDLAREVARRSGRPDSAVEGIRLDEAALLATRPRRSALSNAKLAAAGVTMPSWQDALTRYLG